MSSNEDEERRARISAAIEETLAEKSWPRVNAIFLYFNQQGSPTPDKEVEELENRFHALACPHLAAFAGLVSFEEKHRGYGVQMVSIQLVPRDVDTAKEPTFEQMMRALAQKDIQVGSRHDTKNNAFWWLSNTAEGAEKANLPSGMRMLDNIFAEAVEMMKRKSHSTTLPQMLDSIAPDALPDTDEDDETPVQ